MYGQKLVRLWENIFILWDTIFRQSENIVPLSKNILPQKGEKNNNRNLFFPVKRTFHSVQGIIFYMKGKILSVELKIFYILRLSE